MIQTLELPGMMHDFAPVVSGKNDDSKAKPLK